MREYRETMEKEQAEAIREARQAMQELAGQLEAQKKTATLSSKPTSKKGMHSKLCLLGLKLLLAPMPQYLRLEELWQLRAIWERNLQNSRLNSTPIS